MFALSEALAAWLANNGVLISATAVAAMLLAGGLLIAWAKGYRVVITRGGCAFCQGSGRDPGYQAPRPCRVCHGKGQARSGHARTKNSPRTNSPRPKQPIPSTPEAAEKLTARREAAAHRREALRQAEAMREEDEPYLPIE